MTAKRGVLTVVVVQLVLAVCAGSVAGAATTVTHQSRTRFERAMARYERALATTTTAQVVAQMRAEESALDPCVGQLKNVYQSGSPASGDVDWILGPGVNQTGEQWYTNAAIHLDQALPGSGATGAGESQFWARIRSTTEIDVCGVIDSWSAAAYAEADQPKVLTLLKDYVSPSPVAEIGSPRTWAKTFIGWGFSRGSSKQLVAEFNKALGRYATLNAAAGKQYIAWLKQQFIYELMQPSDRQFMSDDY